MGNKVTKGGENYYKEKRMIMKENLNFITYVTTQFTDNFHFASRKPEAD